MELAPAPGASSSESTWRSSFVGPQGMRSGWSMLIFIVILVVEVLATRVPVNHLLHSMKHNPSLEAWSPAVAAGILALLVLIPTAIMARIEGRPVQVKVGIHHRGHEVAVIAVVCTFHRSCLATPLLLEFLTHFPNLYDMSEMD
jgi:hypothetical protein